MKNIFINNNLKLALINTVACVALLNNGGYTHNANMHWNNAGNNGVFGNQNLAPAMLPVNNNMQMVNQPIPNVKPEKLGINILDNINMGIYNIQNLLNNLQSNYARAGLENLGNLCYMDSTLQFLAYPTFALSLLKSIAKHYFELETKGDQGLLVIEFANVLANLYDPNKKFFKPTKFYALLAKCNPLFKNHEPSDSKDLLIFLLEHLHKELNNPKNKIQMPNTRDPQFNLAVYNHFSQNQSPVVDYCHFIQQQFLTCQFCNWENCSYTIGNFLIFPLEKVRQFKYRGFAGSLRQQDSPITLYDCFDEYSEKELLTGANQIFCNNCHKQSNATTSNKMFSAPKFLHIILNRQKGNTDKINCQIPKYIDLTKYVAIGKDDAQYELVSTTYHIGESGPSGHYMNVSKWQKNWTHYNDAIVTQGFGDKYTKNILNGDNIENCAPYMLLYVKIDKDKQLTSEQINYENQKFYNSAVIAKMNKAMSKAQTNNNNMMNMFNNWQWFYNNMMFNNMGCNNMMMPNMNYNFNNVNWNNMWNKTPMAMPMNNMNMNNMTPNMNYNNMWNKFPMHMNNNMNWNNVANKTPVNNMNKNVNWNKNMMMQQNYNNMMTPQNNNNMNRNNNFNNMNNNYNNNMQNFIPMNQNNMQNKALNNAQFITPSNNVNNNINYNNNYNRNNNIMTPQNYNNNINRNNNYNNMQYNNNNIKQNQNNNNFKNMNYNNNNVNNNRLLPHGIGAS